MVRRKGMERDERKITRHTQLGDARKGKNKEKGKSKRSIVVGKKKKKVGGMGNNRKKKTEIMHMRKHRKKGRNKKRSVKCDNNIQHEKV